jgi:hypothetical protein
MAANDWRERSEQVYVSRALGTKDKIKRLQKKLAAEAGVGEVSQADAIELAVKEALANRRGKNHGTRSQAGQQR